MANSLPQKKSKIKIFNYRIQQVNPRGSNPVGRITDLPKRHNKKTTRKGRLKNWSGRRLPQQKE